MISNNNNDNDNNKNLNEIFVNSDNDNLKYNKNNNNNNNNNNNQIEEDEISNGSSISHFNDEKNPFLINITLYSSIILILNSSISIYLSFSNKKYFLFDNNNYNKSIINKKNNFIALILQCLSNLFVIFLNIYLIFSIKERKSQRLLNIISKEMKFNIFLINLSLSLMYIIKILKENLYFYFLSNSLSLLLCFVLNKSYKKIKSKKHLDFYTLISLSMFISLIYILSLNTFFNYVTDFFIFKFSIKKNENIFNSKIIFNKIINYLLFSISIVYAYFYFDVLFLFACVFFIFTPELIVNINNMNCCDLYCLIFIGYLIIIWLIIKHKKNILEKENQNENSFINFNEMEFITTGNI